MKQEEREYLLLEKIDAVYKTSRTLIGLVQDVRLMTNDYVHELVQIDEPVPEVVPVRKNPFPPKQETLVPTSENEPVEKQDAWESQCDDCGAPTTTKFKPNPKWPIRCLDCFKKHKELMKEND